MNHKLPGQLLSPALRIQSQEGNPCLRSFLGSLSPPRQRVQPTQREIYASEAFWAASRCQGKTIHKQSTTANKKLIAAKVHGHRALGPHPAPPRAGAQGAGAADAREARSRCLLFGGDGDKRPEGIMELDSMFVQVGLI